MRQSNRSPSSQVAVLLRRLGRWSLVLTAVGATSAVRAGDASASVGLRHTAHHWHGDAARLASKPVRHAAVREQHKKVYARTRPAHKAARYAGAMHTGIVPLANTTWDDPQIPPEVTAAIETAARESGVDPHLLVAMAWRESRFNVNARSHQSSAKGLLQFTTETWLQVVRQYGSQHNVGGYAAAIQRDRSGELVVSGKGMRAAILRMRSDPVLSAKLAAHSMIQQSVAMHKQLRRKITPADLYLLHVLGPTGAGRFLTAVARHPSESSVEVASYDVMHNAGLLARDGRPMTVRNTYIAAGAMLNAHHARPELPLPETRAGADTEAATAIQVSVAP